MSEQHAERLIRWHAIQMVSESSLKYRVVPIRDNSPTMAHAAERLLAAADRCKKIEELLDQAAEAWKNHVHVRTRRSGATKDVPELWFGGVPEELAELGRAVSPLASEVIHHARAALDYCMHVACWRDSGTRNPRSQFPLALQASAWSAATRSKWMQGLSPGHVTLVQGVQPYLGATWAGHLVELSNQDKHRTVVEVRPAYQISVNPSVHVQDPLGESDFDGLETEHRVVELLIESAFDPHPNGGGRSALPLLWEIIGGVIGVLNLFLAEEGLPPIQMSTANP